ncbi:hypothetical protein [Azonexus hydrophilus]|uniref:hypothetical protein n=1 Tax=Azonexus hydrophilus TaxID=418702 RepID=UPI0012F91039|nr:hypothetical protein [Azonexus hydrophilus]
MSYYEDNKEVLKAKAKARYEQNKKQRLAKCAEWRKANPMSRWLSSIKRSAKERGIEFDLSIEDIVVPERCPLLGIELRPWASTSDRSDNSVSLDRIDSTKGYVKGNVWVISWRANRLKYDATIDEMELLVKNWRAALE